MAAEMQLRRFEDELADEIELALAAASSVIFLTRKQRKDRRPDERRRNTWWSEGYQSWSDAAFKRRFRVSRATFDFLLNEIGHEIVKQPTRMKPHPTTLDTQLAICLYRLAHGVTYLTVGDLFGVAASTAYCIFMDVCKVLVKILYDRFIYLPKTIDEWTHELQGFLENWEFPCVGAWDGFHVYVSSAPGSTHDSRLLKNCEVYSEIEHGKVLPKKSQNLQPYGEIPLTTVGDSAFPSHSWLLKPYKEGIENPKRNDPCKPRWRLEVNQLNLIRGSGQATNAAEDVRCMISNWLWTLRQERAI
ncbi:uncharacterized protein LOC124449247 [Xenia sp. Carnegie-2017]|uniref:uncharacterized protein LOC124449247 n=1 Tax=Xenia sp. Carnegie-2017 TaxID=2897299 RepID=UPI001F04CF5E|nr:uncharacterized protein LOC124449247 [Xenia sp. Carnegie-2017]